MMIVLVASAITTLSFGQVHFEVMDTMEVKDFNQLVDAVEDYYRDRDKGKGSGYKQFKTWEWLNSGMTSQDGTVINAQERMNELFGKRKGDESKLRGPDDCWVNIAADKYEDGPLGHNGGNGRVYCIAVDPDNENIIYVGTPTNGLWRSETGGSDWSVAGSLPSWTPLMDQEYGLGVSAIVIDPNSPANNRTIYVLTGDGAWGDTGCSGVYVSSDGGASWNPDVLTFSVSDLVLGRDLKRHPGSDLTFAVTSAGLYRSIGGEWNLEAVEEGDFFDLEFRPLDNGQTVYASNANGVIYSTDGGLTWGNSSFTPALPGCSRIELAVVEQHPVTGISARADWVYAICGGGDAGLSTTYGGVYLSTDMGQNFQRVDELDGGLTQWYLGDYSRHGVASGTQAKANLAIAVNPENHLEVHVGGINCWRSMDGGETWENTSHWNTNPPSTEPELLTGQYTHADIHNLDFIGGHLYCSSDGGIFRTDNSAATGGVPFPNIEWKNRSYGLQIGQVYNIGSAINPEERGIVYGMQDNGFNIMERTSGEWDSWTHLYGDDAMESEFCPDNEDYLFFQNQNGSFKRLNTETNVLDQLSSGPVGAWNTPFCFAATDGSLTAGYRNIWRIQDPDATTIVWENLTAATADFPLVDVAGYEHPVHFLEVAPYDSDVIFAGINWSNYAALYMSYDRGLTWSFRSFSTDIAKVVFHPTDRTRAWISTVGVLGVDGGRIFETNNAGLDWLDISTALIPGSPVLPSVPARALAYQNGTENALYVGTDLGVFYKDDTMDEWAPYNAELPKVRVTDLEINYCTDKIYAATYGRGVWEAPLHTSSFASGLTLVNTHDVSRVFMAADYINSSATLSDSPRVVYQASNYIELGQGANLKPNAEGVFCAQIIDACNAVVPLSSRIAQDYESLLSSHELPSVEGNSLEQYESRQKELMAVLNDGRLKLLGNSDPNLCIAEIELAEDSEVHLSIFNVEGRKLKQLKSAEMLQAGIHIHEIETSELARGVYLVLLEYNGLRSVKKLVKL